MTAHDTTAATTGPRARLRSARVARFRPQKFH